MTNEKINVAIAQECGWKFPCEPCAANGIKNRWRRPTNDGCRDQTQLPNYCNDLNAMHEAEATLTNDDWDDKFYHWLGFVVIGKQTTGLWEYRKMIVHATARQRAEAFLRTLGKWND